MRTTLSVENSVDALLRDLAKRQNRTYKEVVNEALLRGIQSLGESLPRTAYRIQPLETEFQPGLDTEKLNQLSDELEADL